MTLEDMAQKIEQTHNMVERLVGLLEQGMGQRRFSIRTVSRMTGFSVSSIVRLRERGLISCSGSGRTCYVIPSEVVQAMGERSRKESHNV